MKEQTLIERQVEFQRLAARTHQRLYNFAWRTLSHHQDAEDLTQEALARAWSHFETFDGYRSFEAWVFRIARNLIIDQHRRRSIRHEVSLDAPAAGTEGNEDPCFPELSDSTGDPQACLLAREISTELQSALHSLPPIYQATILMVAQDHSYEQIARVFDCPMGTVRSRIYRARHLMQRNLKRASVL